MEKQWCPGCAWEAGEAEGVYKTVLYVQVLCRNQ